MKLNKNLPMGGFLLICFQQSDLLFVCWLIFLAFSEPRRWLRFQIGVGRFTPEGFVIDEKGRKVFHTAVNAPLRSS